MPATVDVADVYPNGTSVSVYPQRAQVHGAAPLGPATETEIVASGRLTFGDLTVGESYAAYGTVDGSLVRFDFNVDRPPHIQLYTDEDATITGDWAFEGELDLSLATLVGPIASVVFNVKSYGAVGDGVTLDTAAIQAAIDACVAAGGGTVYFPPGVYLVNGELTVPAGSQVNFQGAGPTASQIKWQTDLGSGKYGIKFVDHADPTNPFGWRKRFIRDLHLLGYHDGTIYSNSMGGVKWVADTIVENCLIEQFRYGLYVWGDHQTLSKSTIRNCYYGVYFADSQPTVGDQYFFASVLAGNRWAGVAIGGVNPMVADFERVHFGNGSPYGILCEAGAGTGIYRSRFSKIFAEAIGAEFIKTNDRWVVESTFDKVIASKNDIHARGEASTAMVDLGTAGDLVDCHFHDWSYFNHSGATYPTTFLRSDSVTRTEFTGMGQLVETHIKGGNWKFAAVSSVNVASVRWGDNEAKLVNVSEIVTQYETLGWYAALTGGTALATRRIQTGDLFGGWALHAGAAAAFVLAQTKGLAFPLLGTGTVAAMAEVSGWSSGRIQTASTGQPVIGVAGAAVSTVGNAVPVVLGAPVKAL